MDIYFCQCNRAVKRRRIDEPDGNDNEVSGPSACTCGSRSNFPRMNPTGVVMSDIITPPQPPNQPDQSSSDEEFSDDENLDVTNPPSPTNPPHNAAQMLEYSSNLQLRVGPSVSGIALTPNSSGELSSPPLGPTAGPSSLANIPVPTISPALAGRTRNVSSGSANNAQSRVDDLGWQESRPSLTLRAEYLLNNSRMSDIRFLVGETKAEIFGHKTILAMGSPVFEAQFYGHVGQGSSMDTLELPDMDPDTFLLFLKYLYTDKLDDKLDDVQLLNLLRPAKKYIVPHLVDKCIDSLMTELKPENVFQTLHNAQFFQLVKLERACERYIDRNAASIVASEEFANLTRPVLSEFLKRDGLDIRENTLFLAVLRWANAECQRSSIESTNENLRQVLGDCMRLIRFPTMSREEFANAYERSGILNPEEACSVFVYMCKPTNSSSLETFLFPTTKRNFMPSLQRASRFAGEPIDHNLNYRSGEIYNYRYSFKTDRHIFLKGVNIFAITCGAPAYQGCKRDFTGALYLYSKSGNPHDGRKAFSKAGALEPDESGLLLNGGRREYFPVLFDSEILLQPGKTHTICVVVSVNSHTYQALTLHSYVGTNERNKTSVVIQEDNLTVNFTFLGSSGDNSVGRFTSAQIPELIFSL